MWVYVLVYTHVSYGVVSEWKPQMLPSLASCFLVFKACLFGFILRSSVPQCFSECGEGQQAARASLSCSPPCDAKWKCEAPQTALNKAHFPSPAECEAVIPTSIKGNPQAGLTPLKQVCDWGRHTGSRPAPAPCPQMAVTMTLVCGLWLPHPAEHPESALLLGHNEWVPYSWNSLHCHFSFHLEISLRNSEAEFWKTYFLVLLWYLLWECLLEWPLPRCK